VFFSLCLSVPNVQNIICHCDFIEVIFNGISQNDVFDFLGIVVNGFGEVKWFRSIS
jgi:hypothetical protein